MRWLTAGESHGPALVAILEGLPAGVSVTSDDIAAALLRLAFEELGVRRVEADCFAENLASRRVMEKIGMRHEGTFREESLHRSGRWLDGMSYALLASEFDSQQTA